jgi:hypothetical protein
MRIVSGAITQPLTRFNQMQHITVYNHKATANSTSHLIFILVSSSITITVTLAWFNKVLGGGFNLTLSTISTPNILSDYSINYQILGKPIVYFNTFNVGSDPIPEAPCVGRDGDIDHHCKVVTLALAAQVHVSPPNDGATTATATTAAQ